MRVALLTAAAGVVARFVMVIASASQGFAHVERFEYETIAHNLLLGRGFGIEHLGVWYRTFGSPPYSALCAGLYALAGHSPLVVLIAQALLSAVTTLGCYSVGRRLFSPATGLMAALAVTLHPGLFYYDTHKLHPLGFDAALAVVGIWLVLKLRDRVSQTTAFLAGVLHGLCVLERATQLALLLLAGWALQRSIRRPARPVHLAVYLFGVAMAVGPWVIRNAVVYGGRPVLVTTMGGEVLWIGNNAQASGGAFAEGRPGVAVFEAAPEPFRQDILGRDEIGQSQRFTQEAWWYLQQHPREALRLFMRKLWTFIWFSPQTGALYPSHYVVLYKWYYGIVLTLAVIGMLLGLAEADTGRQAARVIVLAFIASVAVLQAVFYVEIRHRWGIEPLVIIFSTGTVAWLLSHVQKARAMSSNVKTRLA